MDLRSRHHSMKGKPTKRDMQTNSAAVEAALEEQLDLTEEEIHEMSLNKKILRNKRDQRVDETSVDKDYLSKQHLPVGNQTLLDDDSDATESIDTSLSSHLDCPSLPGKDSESELDSEPESKLDREPESDLDSKPGSELDSEPGSELDSESDSETDSDKFKYQINLFYALPFVVILLAIFYVIPMGYVTSGKRTFQRDMEVFTEGVKSIKKNFPNQNRFMWGLTMGAFQHHHAVKNNTEPAVLFLGHQHQKETTECLAVNQAKLYAHNCNQRIAVFDGMHYSDPDAKMRLRDDIDSAYGNGACAIVMKDFDKIDAMSTLIFYYFCDNSSPFYNNKAIIFTTDLGDPNEQQDIGDYPLKWERSVNDYLEQSLRSRGMDFNMAKALMSRVTPLVGFVKPELDLHVCSY